MKTNDPPCKQSCQNRTATCKFDGSCSLYDEWKTMRTEALNHCWQEKMKDYPAKNYKVSQVVKKFNKKVRKSK